MPWWAKIPEELQPVADYGCCQMVSDYAAGEKDPLAKVALMRERMDQLAAGDFSRGPTLIDIGNAFVLLGKAKTAEAAIAKWQEKTLAERDELLKIKAVADAIEAAVLDRRARAKRAAVNGGEVKF
jgi:hypothetical protein